MFLVEYIVKLFKKKYIEPKQLEEEACVTFYDGTEEVSPLMEEYELCEHLFMPVDSTGLVLACTKCGLLVKKDELHRKNFFEQKND